MANGLRDLPRRRSSVAACLRSSRRAPWEIDSGAAQQAWTGAPTLVIPQAVTRGAWLLESRVALYRLTAAELRARTRGRRCGPGSRRGEAPAGLTAIDANTGAKQV